MKESHMTPSRIHKRNERGETPLHIACIRGDLHLAASLIEQGAEVNARDHAGRLHYLVITFMSFTCMFILLEYFLPAL